MRRCAAVRGSGGARFAGIAAMLLQSCADPEPFDPAGADIGGADADADHAMAPGFRDEFRLPDAIVIGNPGRHLGVFRLTYYWMAVEEEFPGPADTDLFDPRCDLLAVVPEAFARSLAIEGTGRLLDGRILNYHSRCSCPRSPCFFEVNPETHPWGVGVANRPLAPFRSIAVDPAVIPIGSSVYVGEMDGVPMPGEAPWGGFVHDGCVVADDRGGGVDGMHIDFYAALRSYYREIASTLRLDSVNVYEGGWWCP